MITHQQEQLILENMGLIGVVIKQYHFQNNDLNLSYLDLASIGKIGLVEGVRDFDPDKGYKISTFLCLCIKNRITNYMRVCHAKKRQPVGGRVLSLDQEISFGKDTVTLEYFAARTDCLGLDEQLIQEELYEALFREIRKLDDFHREILCYSFSLFSHPHMTQTELAEKFGVKQPFISKELQWCLAVLRENLREFE